MTQKKIEWGNFGTNLKNEIFPSRNPYPFLYQIEQCKPMCCTQFALTGSYSNGPPGLQGAVSQIWNRGGGGAASSLDGINSLRMPAETGYEAQSFGASKEWYHNKVVVT